MNMKRYWIAAGLLLLVAAGAVTVVVLIKQWTVVQAVRETVETFCRNEFEGNDALVREQVVKFSPGTGSERGDDVWRMMYVEHRPLVVVDSYEVKEVHVEGNLASAVVAYRRLARTKHPYSGSYVPDKKDNDLVTLTLVFDKGPRPPAQSVSFITAAWNAVFIEDQWWVLNPPVQRVSKQVLLEYYEEKVREYSSTWERELNNPNYSANQKADMRASQDQATRTLRFLKSLP